MAREKITVEEIRSIYLENTYAHWVGKINTKLRCTAKGREKNFVEVHVLDTDVIPSILSFYKRAGFSVMQIDETVTISW